MFFSCSFPVDLCDRVHYWIQQKVGKFGASIPFILIKSLLVGRNIIIVNPFYFQEHQGLCCNFFVFVFSLVQKNETNKEQKHNKNFIYIVIGSLYINNKLSSFSTRTPRDKYFSYIHTHLYTSPKRRRDTPFMITIIIVYTVCKKLL